jgi:hypothetical protein
MVIGAILTDLLTKRRTRKIPQRRTVSIRPECASGLRLALKIAEGLIAGSWNLSCITPAMPASGGAADTGALRSSLEAQLDGLNKIDRLQQRDDIFVARQTTTACQNRARQ